MSKEKLSFKKKAGAVGVGLLALAGSFQAGRSVENHGTKNSAAIAESSGKSAATGAEIIADELRYKAPIKFLNGSLAEDRKDGSTWVYSNPIVVYSGDPHVKGKLDTANFHFFTATQDKGVPTVKEIQVTSKMRILGPANDSDPLTFDAILAPVQHTPGTSTEFDNAYAVESYPADLYIGSQGKGGLFYVGTPEAVVSQGK